MVVGIATERVEVRERCILTGSVFGSVMTSGVITWADDAMTIDAIFLVVISILSVARGVVHSPWTTTSAETCEVRVPELVATGRASRGRIPRGVAACQTAFGQRLTGWRARVGGQVVVVPSGLLPSGLLARGDAGAVSAARLPGARGSGGSDASQARPPHERCHARAGRGAGVSRPVLP